MDISHYYSYKQGPDSKYQWSSFYTQLVKKYENILNAPSERVEFLLSPIKDYHLLIKRIAKLESREDLVRTSYAVLLIFVANIFYLLIKNKSYLALLYLPLPYLVLFIIHWLCKRYRKSYVHSLEKLDALLTNDSELIKLHNSAGIACNQFAQEFDSYCEKYSGYPPDWTDRKDFVKDRDNNSCTRCGYSDGLTTISDKLHVHHIIPLSQGGDNSLENLTTLCDVCHSNMESPGHSRFIPISRNKKKAIRRGGNKR